MVQETNFVVILVNYRSWHPVRYKFNTMHNLMVKAIGLTDINFLREVRFKVYKLLLDNWYPLSTIHDHWIRCIMKLKVNQINYEGSRGVGSTDNPKSSIEYRSCDYIEGLSEKISNILRNQGFRNLCLAFKPVNKVSQFVHNMKDKIHSSKEKDLIYKITCLDCPRVYIGHTSMWLENRIYHHKSNAKNSTKTNTALSAHLQLEKHTAGWENKLILHKESKVD